MDLCHLIEVKIIGHDFGLPALGDLKQLQVHFAHLGGIVRSRSEADSRRLLQPLHDVETTASAVAPDGIGGISHHLQFAQNELRNQEHSLEKPRFGDIRDAAVDEHAGVKELPGSLFDHANPAGRLPEVRFFHADGQAHVGGDQRNHNRQEPSAGMLPQGPNKYQAEQAAARQASYSPE